MIKFVNAVLRAITRKSKHELLTKHAKPNLNIAKWLIDDWETNWGVQETKLISDQLMKEPFIDLSVKAFYFDYKNDNNDIQKKQQIELERIQYQLLDDYISDKNSKQEAHNQPSMEEMNKSFRKNDELESKIQINDKHKESVIETVLLPHGIIRTKHFRGAINSWPLYNEGLWWVQDAASALPALALCNGLRQKFQSSSNYLSKLHVVDMCSAPGGKCAQLLSAGIGHVTAIEANKRRSKRLLENLNRLKFTTDQYTVVVANGQDWFPNYAHKEEGSQHARTFQDNVVSGVLVDVPCSATGTGSKRPDVLRKDPTDLDELLLTQEALANHCADVILEKGGIMVYATCSLLKRESEDQVKKLIWRGHQQQKQSSKTNVRKVGKMETLPFLPGEIPGFDDAIDENGWLRVLPGLLNGELKSCDGFFVARLIKTE